MESVTIVSNASKLREKWFEKYGQYIDVLAVSIDSCDNETNIKIGRGRPGATIPHVENIRNAASLCREYGIKFKIYSVVNSFNYQVRIDE